MSDEKKETSKKTEMEEKINIVRKNINEAAPTGLKKIMKKFGVYYYCFYYGSAWSCGN